MDARVVHAFGGLAQETLLHVKLFDNEHGDSLERRDNALAIVGRSREERNVPRVQLGIHLVQGEHAIHIALVVLKHEGHIVQVHPVILQILAQVLEAFQIFRLAGTLGVGDKDDSVYTA